MLNKAPIDIFQKTVQYFPTVSINLVIQNDAGEFLFVKRKNNPAKGLFWVPGGRILAGETLAVGATRILHEETGIDTKIDTVPHTFFEEIFSTANFDESDRSLYPPEVHHVHYLATAVYIRVHKNEHITLDHQSSEYLWSKDIPNNHQYLKQYFDLVKDHIT